MKKQLIIAVVLVMMAFSFGNAWSSEGSKLDGAINMNTATAEELMLLPGVGEAKAKLILDARSQKPFSKKEDLLEIKGVGEKLIAKWSSYLVFDGKTSLKEVEVK